MVERMESLTLMQQTRFDSTSGHTKDSEIDTNGFLACGS